MADLRSVCLCVVLSANKFTWAEYDFSFIFRIICLDLCDKFDNSSIVFKALCFPYSPQWQGDQKKFTKNLTNMYIEKKNTVRSLKYNYFPSLLSKLLTGSRSNDIYSLCNSYNTVMIYIHLKYSVPMLLLNMYWIEGVFCSFSEGVTILLINMYWIEGLNCVLLILL